ncbi:hypothetical protein DPMN_143785 [Dreissena polymorpha]|uniref:Uncharacterized protein n=1 Tax=Dreissena polymorpha TaxID=45954 RepID=A0A9D4GH10_DREPO|nr:hypothetical protein DPMN_143785 [Dreissena polymorpha]
MYPQLGSDLYSTTLNILVLPRQYDGSGTGYIRWSSPRHDMTSSNLIPNHFVPVVNTTVSSSGSLIKEMFEEDKEMFEEDYEMILLDSNTLSGILKDLNDE